MLVAASSLQGSISAGAGSSYDYAGVRVELRLGHVAASAAWGASLAGINLLDDGGAAPNRNVDWWPALSLRVFSGDGQGWMLAGTWNGHGYERNYDDPCCYDKTARIDILSLVVGYRARFASRFYLEIAFGLADVLQSGHPSLCGDCSEPGPFVRTSRALPDGAIGIGLEL